MRSVVLAILCLVLPVLARAGAEDGIITITRADLVRMLGQLTEVAPIREDMRALGFRGENLELAVAQNRAFYTDPRIAGYIADRLISAYARPVHPGRAEGLIRPLIDGGLGYLPTRKLKYFYEVELAMLDALPVRTCGQAVRNRLSDQDYSDAMTRVAARLNTPALREYYRIQLWAARLGATRRAVRLDPRETARIAARVRQEMDALIAAAPDPGRLRTALRNIDRADNAQACAVERMFYRSVLRLKGRELRDALIYLGQP